MKNAADSPSSRAWLRSFLDVTPAKEATLAAVFVIIKVLAVANYDPGTALAVVQGVGAFSVLIGALVVALPYLIVAGVLVGALLLHQDLDEPLEVISVDHAATADETSTTMTFAHDDDADADAPTRPAIGGVISAAVLVMLFVFAPWQVATIGMVATLGAWFFYPVPGVTMPNRALELAAQPDPPLDEINQVLRADWERHSRRRRNGLLVALLIVMALFVLNRTPWLASEQVTIRHRAAPVTAYVLSANAPWASLLFDGSREVHYVPATAISRRALCKIRRGLLTSGQTPLQLIRLVRSAQQRYPKCAD